MIKFIWFETSGNYSYIRTGNDPVYFFNDTNVNKETDQSEQQNTIQRTRNTSTRTWSDTAESTDQKAKSRSADESWIIELAIEKSDFLESLPTVDQ